jgi:hypothetical protein
VRRSCHTSARASGSPLILSHATTVSRWLVTPIAAMRSAPPACATISIAHSKVRCQISPASCSTQPGARIVLRQLALRDAARRAVGTEQHRPGRGRAFVEDQDQRFRHFNPPPCPPYAAHGAPPATLADRPLRAA